METDGVFDDLRNGSSSEAENFAKKAEMFIRKTFKELFKRLLEL